MGHSDKSQSAVLREAKWLYSEKLQHQFSANNSMIWLSIFLTKPNFRPKSPDSINDLALTNELNVFYCCFERQWDSDVRLTNESFF